MFVALLSADGDRHAYSELAAWQGKRVKECRFFIGSCKATLVLWT